MYTNQAMPRKNKSQDSNPYEGLRGIWEIPYLMQILKLLKDKLHLADFSIQDLEDSFLEDHSVLLCDTFARLLRYLSGSAKIVIGNFEEHLQEVLNEKKADHSSQDLSPLAGLSPEAKVQRLKWLVDLILEVKAEEVDEYLNDHHEPDDLRAINAGQDAFNNSYWYFDDLRLYRENSGKKGTKNYWEAVCITLDDWYLFLKQFRKTNNPQEKELYCYINEELFPLIEYHLKIQEESTLSLRDPHLEPEVLLEREKDELSAMLKESADTTNHDNNSKPTVKLENGVDNNNMDIKDIKDELIDEKPFIETSKNVPTPTKVINGEHEGLMSPEEIQIKKLQENGSAGNDDKDLVKLEHHDVAVSNPSVPVSAVGQQQPPSGATQRLQHRTPASMDTQFVQQQSQIFVFTTEFANKAANAVLQGQYKNMLAYHMDQPATKKFLQKNPMNFPNFNRSGCPPNFMRNPSMKGPGPMMNFNPGQNNTSVAQWVQQQNAQLREQGINFPASSPSNNQPGQMPMPHPAGGLPQMGPNFLRMQEEMGFEANLDGPNMNMQMIQRKMGCDNNPSEQIPTREEKLANLRKIQEKFLPELRPNQQGPQQFPMGQWPGPGPGGMMPPDNMQMFSQMMASQQPNNMTSPQGMMTSPQNMMSSQQEMMSSQMMGGSPRQFMLSQQQQNMSPFGSHISPDQQEWMRLQKEFYSDKRRMQHHQHQMNQMEPGVELPEGLHAPPPPSYYTSMVHKRQGVMSTSPNMNGPLSSPQLPPDPQDPLAMFPPQRRPSMSAMDQPNMDARNPGFHSPRPHVMDPLMGQGDPAGPHMPPDGVLVPHMPPDDILGPHMPPDGVLGSHMPPGALGPRGPPGPHMNPGDPGMPPMDMLPFSNNIHPMKNMLPLHRAGNPEPFQPDVPNTLGNKPPPSYAQSQKRKRDDIEDLYKNLQPTPSPHQIDYLNQFEGHELTITKQLNTAYREQNDSQPNKYHHGHPAVNSPMHGPASNKCPTSNSSQTSNPGPLTSPVPGPSPMSGAAKRLSHYDPPPSNSSISSAPTTPTAKMSHSNLTSSSLADLAKGVENLSNQMEQNMLQGGPFHSIQVQGQPNNSNNNNMSSTSTQPTANSQQSSATQAPPSVNNTFVNATMSIQQLNIQSVNTPSCNPAMHIQQMNNDPSHMNMGQVGGHCMPPEGGHPGMPPMGQQGTFMPGGMPHHGVGHPMSAGNQHMGRDPQMSYGNMAPGCAITTVSSMSQSQTMLQSSNHMGKHQFPSPQPGQMNPIGGHVQGANAGNMLSSSGRRLSSPNFPPSSGGNANVQIQPKAPNTIQYLPANPPSNPTNMGAGGPQKRPPDMDFMQRFSSPIPNMDGGGKPHPGNKMPPYFQGNNVQGMHMPEMMPSNQSITMQQQQAMMMNSNKQGGHPGMRSGRMSSPGPNIHHPNMAGNPLVEAMNPSMMGSLGGTSMDRLNLPALNSSMNSPLSPADNGMASYGSPPFPCGNQQMMNPCGGGPMMQGQPMPNMMQAMHRQQGPSMRAMNMQGGMPSNAGPGYNPQFLQMQQQQMYSQAGHSRQMSPMSGMMGAHQGQPPFMGMMPNMPGSN